VVLLEGWCLGLPPQAEVELVEPQNQLERECDIERVWRTTVNRALATSYAALFGELDLLVALVAPKFEVVFDWRRQQEADLMLAIAHQTQDSAEAGIRGRWPSVPREPLRGLKRDDAELSAFIAHFERLTRHGLACWPSVADLSLFLDETRHVVHVAERPR